MGGQRWERIGFLILFFVIIAVVSWALITKQPFGVSQTESAVSISEASEASPRIVSQVQPIRDVAEEAQKAKRADAAKQAEVEKQAKAAKQLKLRQSLKVSIPVFASRLEGDKAFTSFTGWSDLIVTEAGSDWSKVASSKGFPVWISLSLVEKIGNSHVRVKSNNVNLRSIPKVQGSRVLGRAQAGDIMKINRKQGDWLRVWSPLRVTAWAKSAQLVPQNADSSSVQTPK